LTTQPAPPSTHPTKMRLYYMVSGILLILPTIYFAVATPVPVQEKHKRPVDMGLIPEDSKTMLGKRGDEVEMYELSRLILAYGQKPDRVHENPFAKPEGSSAAPPPSSPRPSRKKPKGGWTDLKKLLPTIPEDSPMYTGKPSYGWASPESLGSEHDSELMEGDAPGRWSPASSTTSDADHELVGAHALQPSREPDHLLTPMDELLSGPLYSTWFHPADHGLMGAHAPQPNLGSSSTRPPTEFDSDHGLVVKEPPSGPGSPAEFDSDDELVVL
jgi:hypothetical protein